MSSGLTWITGAGGLIGNQLVRAARAVHPPIPVLGLTRARVDLTDFAAVDRLWTEHPPAGIIHCAAISRSPVCQADPALARRVNVDVTRHLAGRCVDGPFVLFSTDLVFDGRKGSYRETDAVNPLSVYAETKVEAEAVTLADPRHLVIRTSLNGGASPTGDRGFNEELRRAWERGQSLRLFTDEFRCPIAASVTAAAVWELVARRAAGCYHICGSERLSRYQIGRLVADRCPELNPRLEPGSLTQYAGAPRPPDTALDCAKAQALLSFPLPGLTRWLAEHPDEPF